MKRYLIYGLLATILFSCKKENDDSETVDLTTGLIAHWPLNGTGTDTSGKGNHATLYNLKSTTDRFGKSNSAFYFNGTNGYASVADNIDLRLSNTDFTVNAWVHTNAYHSSYGGIIMGKRLIGVDNGWSWSVAGHQGSSLGITAFGPGGGSIGASGTVKVGLFEWHMVTGVYKLSTGVFSIYVDGILDNTTPGLLPCNGSITQSLFIGRDPGTGSFYFQGKMDDLRIYHRALNATEITHLKNSDASEQEKPADLTTGLIAHWPLNGNGTDISGKGNHATLYNLTSATDRFGKSNSAFYFNGTNGYASVADNISLRLNNTDYTVNAWVQPESYNSSFGGIIMGKRLVGLDNGWSWSVAGYQGSSLGITAFGPGGGSVGAPGTVKVGLNEWHMVTGVYKLSTGMFSIYVDGILDNTTPGLLPCNGSITQSLFIGRDPGTGSFYFHGKMDDLRIYGRALTPSEINQL